VQRYGSATYKATAATVLDQNGKPTISLTYGKLLSRTHKIAYNLLNKVGPNKGDSSIKPGDRVSEGGQYTSRCTGYSLISTWHVALIYSITIISSSNLGFVHQVPVTATLPNAF
jgi:acyl-CoA synthetase (AMP-forming)/AMP-acid ligase II